MTSAQPRRLVRRRARRSRARRRRSSRRSTWCARDAAGGAHAAGASTGSACAATTRRRSTIEELSPSRGAICVTAPGDGAKIDAARWCCRGSPSAPRRWRNGLCRAAVEPPPRSTCRRRRFEHTGSDAARSADPARAAGADERAHRAGARARSATRSARWSSPSPTTPLFVLQSAARVAGGGGRRDRPGDEGVRRRRVLASSCRVERLFRDARAGWVMAPTVDHLEGLHRQGAHRPAAVLGATRS